MQTSEVQTAKTILATDGVHTPLYIALPKDTTPLKKQEEPFFSKFVTQQTLNHPKKDSIVYRQSLFTGHELQSNSLKYKNFKSNNNIIISLLLLSSLCILAVLYKQYKNRLSHYFKACFSTRQLLQVRKDTNIQAKGRHVLASLFFALIWALAMVRSVHFFGLSRLYQFSDITLFFVGFSVFFIFMEIKYIWAFFLSFLFEDREMLSHYTSHIIVSYLTYAFLALPFLTLSYLSDVKFNEFFLQATVVILSISYLIYLFRSLIIFFSFSKFSKLYLFLYLCTVEIIPLLIASKLMTSFI